MTACHTSKERLESGSWVAYAPGADSINHPKTRRPGLFWTVAPDALACFSKIRRTRRCNWMLESISQR